MTEETPGLNGKCRQAYGKRRGKRRGNMLAELIRRAQDENESVCDEVFEGELLTDENMSQIEFERVRFVKCRFEHCNFDHAAFYHGKFVNCDFSNCSFVGSYWKKMEIAGSKGNGARLSEAVFKECRIEESLFDYADFSQSSWEACAVGNSKFRESFWTEVKLKKVNFQAVDFCRSDFFKTRLAGIDFSGCIIDGIQISTGFAELRGIKIGLEQAVSLAGLLGAEVV